KWNTDTIPATILQQTDSSITLLFASAWSGDLVATAGNCDIADTLRLEAYAVAEQLELGPDTILCPGSFVELTATAGFSNYKWNTGETSPAIRVITTGKYFVTVTDHCGNSFTDTIIVKPPTIPFPAIKDGIICKGDSLFILPASGFNNYNWSPAVQSQGDGYVVRPGVSTAYTVRAKDNSNCTWQKKFIVIVENCPDEIWFPSGFTPNNDGLNDGFGPSTKARFRTYSFRIFNRWGQEVFSSSVPGVLWNGKYRSVEAPAGIYVWMCSYQFRNGPVKNTKGTVSLIR
ncbi:MAG TPA: gliding motility-associated C-terminal domain-containing protein, partial [Chitinophagaceae bacterium]|nr:gliding motility-associated C-terminal domain-containing protein [Chitinophagaceae bacterium]